MLEGTFDERSEHRRTQEALVATEILLCGVCRRVGEDFIIANTKLAAWWGKHEIEDDERLARAAEARALAEKPVNQLTYDEIRKLRGEGLGKGL